MESFYQLNIASIILTILLFIIFLIRNSYPTISRRLFKYLIAFNALSAGCEILVVFLGKGMIVLPSFWQQFFVILYYLIHITLHYIFLYYVTSSIRGFLATKAEKIVFSIFYSGLVLFILTNPLHHLVFNFQNNLYEYGPGLIVIISLCALSLVYSFILTAKYKKKFKKIQIGLDLFFLITWFAAILVEVLVKHIYIENFTITITVLLCTIVTDNPDKYFYADTGVYNEETFNMVYGEKLKNKIGFKLLCFNYKDFNLYIQKVGLKRANVAVFETLKHLKKDYGQQNVFTLRRNIYVIDITKLNKDIEVECQKIFENCYKGGLQFNSELKLEAQFTVVECPTQCESLTDLHSAISMMLFDPENIKDKLITPFDTKLLSVRHRREKIIIRIHDAIEHDGFEMYYQPLYNWKKDKYLGLEALIRFKDNGDEFFSPGEFIPIAEEEGLIFEIDEIVFEKVCRFIRNNNLPQYGVEFIDINLSLLKLLDPATVDRYKELAARYEVDPKFINLEITETAEGDGKYLNVVRNNIARFRDAGFSFSLDDYGSGYSTVVYMAEMDVKIVKIDASILWNAMKNKKYYTVLENCVRLIYCFDKDCVCEGVEDEAMATLLKKLGVDFFQGYLYSKPVNEEQILKLLTEKNKVGGGLLKANSKKIANFR